MDRSHATPKRVARTILIGIGLVALALLLWAGRDVLFLLFFGLLVGIFFSVFTDPLERLGLHRYLALALVVLLTLGISVGFWMLLWPTLSAQLSTVGEDVPRAVQQIGDWAESQYREVAGEIGGDQRAVEERIRTQAMEQVSTVVGGALPVINTVFGALAGALIVFVVGVYSAARPELYRGGFIRLLPPRYRDRVRRALDESAQSLRRWMVGTLINMVLVGLLIWIGLLIVGIPAALALAVIAGILEFIPIVGPIIASIPAIAVGLTDSPMTALWVTVVYIVVQQIESNLITPLVMRGTVHLPPALTVLFQSLMAVVFGFLGLLLAVPLLAVALVAGRTLYVEPMERREGQPG